MSFCIGAMSVGRGDGESGFINKGTGCGLEGLQEALHESSVGKHWLRWPKMARCLWLMPVILATQEVHI
jgi:hypothetical protein